MSNEPVYENISGLSSSSRSSASEHHSNRENSLSSESSGPRASMDTNQEQTNLPRFPEDSTELNKDHSDITSPPTVPTNITEQTNASETQHSLPETNNETQKSEQDKTLVRSDEAVEKHEEQQQSEQDKTLGRSNEAVEKHEEQQQSDKDKTLGRSDEAVKKHEEQQKKPVDISEKEEKVKENTDVSPIRPALTPLADITGVHVQEFRPTSDPKLYAGSDFTDAVPVIASSVVPPLPRLNPTVDNNTEQEQPLRSTATTTTITDETTTGQGSSSANNAQAVPEVKPLKTKKAVGCCILS